MAAGASRLAAALARRVSPANGAIILKPLAPTERCTKDFHVQDPDRYILCFGGATTVP